MDIENQSDLLSVLGWIDRSDEKSLNKREREMLALLNVLMRNCTPYLGGHQKVEEALATFRENLIH